MTDIGAVAGPSRLLMARTIVNNTSQQISEAEEARRARQRAMSIPEFCARYGISRTMAYAEILAKRLLARKAGKRTIITEDDAEDWLRRLPTMGAAQ